VLKKTEKQLESVVELSREGFIENTRFETEWKREGVMDGESSDEGDDELVHVRSDH